MTQKDYFLVRVNGAWTPELLATYARNYLVFGDELIEAIRQYGEQQKEAGVIEGIKSVYEKRPGLGTLEGRQL